MMRNFNIIAVNQCSKLWFSGDQLFSIIQKKALFNKIPKSKIKFYVNFGLITITLLNQPSAHYSLPKNKPF